MQGGCEGVYISYIIEQPSAAQRTIAQLISRATSRDTSDVSPNPLWRLPSAGKRVRSARVMYSFHCCHIVTGLSFVTCLYSIFVNAILSKIKSLSCHLDRSTVRCGAERSFCFIRTLFIEDFSARGFRRLVEMTWVIRFHALGRNDRKRS